MALVDELDLMAIMPRDLQLNVLFTLVPSYDVQWDIEYLCKQPRKDTTVYHSPCDLMCMIEKKWENMAETLLDQYGWGLLSVNYLSRLIDLIKKGYLKENGTTLRIDAHILLRWDFVCLSTLENICTLHGPCKES